MIVLMLSLNGASGATPDELARLAHDARDELARCELEGCDPAEAAEAAWALALDTYVSRGVADGRLAATVEALDPELFESLPEVVREAVTIPLDWVEELDVRVPPETLADAAEPPQTLDYRPWLPPLTVEVVDGSGAPVGGAMVRFTDEGDLHRAHSESGRWTGSIRYLPDGGERAFEKGDVVELEVFAAGYDYVRQTVELKRRRRNTVQVVLEPRRFEAPEHPPVGIEAVESWERWVAAEEALIATPSDGTARAAHRAAAETARLAREWMDLGGGDDARELCLMTGTLALCGG